MLLFFCTYFTFHWHLKSNVYKTKLLVVSPMSGYLIVLRVNLLANGLQEGMLPLCCHLSHHFLPHSIGSSNINICSFLEYMKHIHNTGYHPAWRRWPSCSSFPSQFNCYIFSESISNHSSKVIISHVQYFLCCHPSCLFLIELFSLFWNYFVLSVRV